MTRLTIESLGAQGDGIANTPSGPVFVPQALPGEEVEAEIVKGRARAVSVVTQAPQRVTPPCKHFHDCGGCVIQHLERSPYEEWKRQKVVQALGSRGLQAQVEPLVNRIMYVSEFDVNSQGENLRQLLIEGKENADELLEPVTGFKKWRRLREDHAGARKFFAQRKQAIGAMGLTMPLLYREQARDKWAPLRGIWAELFTKLLERCGMRSETPP